MKVTLLYFDGCPNWRVTRDQLASLAEELGFELEQRQVHTPEEAEQLTFRGSPTVLVDGRDPFARGDEPVGLACRLYVTDDRLSGRPSEQQLRQVLQGAG